ncbi:MAG: hypothetical protein IJN80_05245 [Clostridia bacterium]|nr:hypothetical protein [Clostridia bacterium]
MDQERLKELKKACKGKRAVFVEHLMECEDRVEAIIRAGVTENRRSASTIASRWLLEPAVRAYRDALQEAVAEEINVNKNTLLAKAERIYRKSIEEKDLRGAAKAVELQAKLCGELTEKREIEGNGFSIKVERREE